MAAAYDGRVRVATCDVEANPALVAKLDVRSVPTLLMFKNGEISSRQVGAAPKQKLQQWISGGK